METRTNQIWFSKQKISIQTEHTQSKYPDVLTQHTFILTLIAQT